MKPLVVNIHTINHERLDITSQEDKDKNYIYSRSYIQANIRYPMESEAPHPPVPEVDLGMHVIFNTGVYDENEYRKVLRFVLAWPFDFEINLGMAKDET